MKKFSLAGFFMNRKMIFSLLKLITLNPGYLKTDVSIDSVFGIFPNAIWAGGRIAKGENVSKTYIKSIIEYFRQVDLHLRFTFSNSLLERKHLKDYYCNMILELGHSSKNAIILNSEILENYIRGKYPLYKIIASVTANNRDIDWLKRRQNEVDLLVIPSDLNKNEEIFSELNSEKIEIIANEYCHKDCKFRNEHYDLISRGNIEHIHDIDIFFCKKKHKNKENRHELILNTEYINKLYKVYKISNFKTSGRNIAPENYIEILLKYLIKEDQQIHFLINFYKLYANMPERAIYKI